MPITIHCVRHGESYHCLGPQFHELLDAKLTPEGEEQCHKLRTQLSDQASISLVAASPLSRTLQTANIVFGPALRNGSCNKQVLAMPDLQETSTAICDLGSDVDVLKKLCEENEWHVDMSLIHPSWNIKTPGGRYSSNALAIRNRARDARRFIRERAKELEACGHNDLEIALVSHGRFLHFFTEDWEGSTRLIGTGWSSCEMRSYQFAHDQTESDALLLETMVSRMQRGIDSNMPTRDEQEKMFEQSIKEWEEQDFRTKSSGSYRS